MAPAPTLISSGINSSDASPPRGAGRSICGAPDGFDAAWTDGGSVAAALAVTPATDGGAEVVEAVAPVAPVALGLHSVTGTVCASPTDAIASSGSSIACVKPGVDVLVGVGVSVAADVDVAVAASVALDVGVAVAVGVAPDEVVVGVAAVGDGVPAVGEGVPAVGDGVPAVGDGVPGVDDGVLAVGVGVSEVGVGVSVVGVPAVGEGVPAEGDGVPAVGDGVPADGDGVPVGVDDDVAVYMVGVWVAIAAAV